MYKQPPSTIRIDNDLESEPLKAGRGLRESDKISPELFTLVLDDIFKSFL